MKKVKFNIFAGLFGRLWFAWHFLFWELAIITSVNLVVSVGLQLAIIYTYQNDSKITVMSLQIGLILMFLRFFIFGFLGNTLLQRNRQRAKRKMERGIFCNIEYLRCHEKSVVFRGASAFLFNFLLTIINFTIFPMIVDAILYF